MKSVGIRRHHRRIQHQEHMESRARRERAFKQKEHYDDAFFAVNIIVSIAAMYRGLTMNFRRFINQFFTTPKIKLNLTIDSPFGPGTSRDAGAQYLRSIWPGLGTMVSTRDGKIIR